VQGRGRNASSRGLSRKETKPNSKERVKENPDEIEMGVERRAKENRWRKGSDE
jgi:hypothetical protein